jgi:hypothetical protein
MCLNTFSGPRVESVHPAGGHYHQTAIVFLIFNNNSIDSFVIVILYLESCESSGSLDG